MKNKFKCAKCGHEWLSRKEKPNKCPNPKCQRKNWESTENKIAGRKNNTIERFTKMIEDCGYNDSECWLYPGTINCYGRGMYKLNGKYWLAHRLSYTVFVGEIPSGLNVCHKCDTPDCVNPNHLFLGTTQDNVDDRVSKGRSAIGERNWNTKLSSFDVEKIKSADFSTHGSKARMARELGISQTALGYILSRRSWKYI